MAKLYLILIKIEGLIFKTLVNFTCNFHINDKKVLKNK